MEKTVDVTLGIGICIDYKNLEQCDTFDIDHMHSCASDPFCTAWHQCLKTALTIRTCDYMEQCDAMGVVIDHVHIFAGRFGAPNPFWWNKLLYCLESVS